MVPPPNSPLASAPTAQSSNRLDETIQLSSSDRDSSAVKSIQTKGTRDQKSRAELPRHVALVQGSAPSLSHEANAVLRDRLRVTSIILSVGFATLFLQRLIFPSMSLVAEPILIYSNLAVILVTAFVGHRLCAKCPHILRHLRFAEILVFGSMAFFFSVITYHLLETAAEYRYAPPISGPWTLLIFTYALLIPNNWQRAAVVVSCMAILPISVLLIWRWTTPDVTRVYATEMDFYGMLGNSATIMALVSTLAIWGVKLIRSLRRAAFEARQLGQYQLKRPLGAGGMGQVFLAEHLMLKRPCAIKLIRPEMAGNPETLARFEREVQSMARLTHWNTVEVFDYGRADDGTFYYVMEYLPGMNLDQLVRQFGPMPPARVVHLLMQTCDALEEAHTKELIHRDIKPANIFAARRGGRWDVAKLLDFGLVRSSRTTTDIELTQQGDISGSPLYMSPEQALGENLDVRTDIYSLGAVAYFLLTGRPPFEDSNPLRVIMAHARDVAVAPNAHGVDISEKLQDIVMQCLAKKRDDRFASAQELHDALGCCTDIGTWTQADAVAWWQTYGCPSKKQLDAEVFDDKQVACPNGACREPAVSLAKS